MPQLGDGSVATALSSATEDGATTPESFKVEHGQFLLDGKPFQILAGEMHPARIPRPYWKQRIQMAKAMGLNAVSVYVFWNALEPEPGKFNFSGENDIPAFVKLCKKEGLYVILRPGPYVCAEWEFGGYPYWLLNIQGLTVRSNNIPFLHQTGQYLDELGKRLHNLQITHGGNILMVQVENEYGSYGKDKTYMEAIRNQLIHAGFDTPFYVAEGGSQLANAWIPGTVAGNNGGSWPDVVQTTDRYTPGGPYFVPEFYPGWLDHWAEPFQKTNGDVNGFANLVQNKVSVSIYMFHGGTNFGFMNGSNYDGKLQPSITSYDYDAPLDEGGKPNAKFFAYQRLLKPLNSGALPKLPEVPKRKSFGTIVMQGASSIEQVRGKVVHQGELVPMEALGQGYGYVDYATTLPSTQGAKLTIGELHDFATVLINRRYVGVINSMIHQDSIDLPPTKQGDELEVLVENCGRINYGGQLPNGHKGILGKVTLKGQFDSAVDLSEWSEYSLPFKSAPADSGYQALEGPGVYAGTLNVDTPADTYLDMRNFQKGIVFVNGHNLGRYWRVGPQQTLYVPGCWLKKGANPVEIFEQMQPKSLNVPSLDHAVLDELDLKS